MVSDEKRKPRVLVCLNSGQVIQNLIAAANMEPCRVVVFSTPETEKQLNNLLHALRLEEVDLFCDPCEVPAYDFESLEKIFLEWAAHNEETLKSSKIILNATGGTKPMAIVAQQVLKACFPDIELIYVESAAHQQIVRYHPSPIEAMPIKTPVKLPAYFACYGFDTDIKTTPSYDGVRFDSLFQYIAEEFRECSRIFSTILKDNIPRHIQRTKKTEKLLNCLQAAGVINNWNPLTLVCDKDESNPYYRDLFHREHNGWLEVYIYRLLKEMGYKNVFRGVCLKPLRGNDNEWREFDVVVLDGVKLTIFECKTGHGVEWKDTIHYVQSTSKISGGAFATPVLVVSHKKAIPTEFAKSRAELSSVEIIDHDDFKNKKRLKSILKNIIEKKARTY